MPGAPYVPNPDMFRELARGDEMRDFLLERATTGAGIARATVKTYGGPTWKRGVTRMGDYAARTFAEAVLTPSGWRSEFGSNAPWTLQVEYGTGKKKRRQKTTYAPVSLMKAPRHHVSLVKGRNATRRRRTPNRGRRIVTVWYVRTRPQKGYNEKQRVLMRSLLALKRR